MIVKLRLGVVVHHGQSRPQPAFLAQDPIYFFRSRIVVQDNIPTRLLDTSWISRETECSQKNASFVKEALCKRTELTIWRAIHRFSLPLTLIVQIMWQEGYSSG